MWDIVGIMIMVVILRWSLKRMIKTKKELDELRGPVIKEVSLIGRVQKLRKEKKT